MDNDVEANVGNSGVGEPKKASWLSKFAAGAAAGAALFGGAAIVQSATQAHAEDSGAKVTIVKKTDQNNSASEQNHNTNPESVSNSPSFFEKVFGGLSPEQKEQAMRKVEKYKNLISSGADMAEVYSQMAKYDSVIQQTAQKYGISPHWLRGMVAVESKGDPDAYNDISGAAGIVQFMEATGIDFGLVDKKNGIDNRYDPYKSIDAAGKYLSIIKNMAGGNEALAGAAYHAGEGNLFRMLGIYFENAYGITEIDGVRIGDYSNAIVENDAGKRQKIVDSAKKLIQEKKVNIEQMFENSAVKEFTAGLKDNSEAYVYELIAGDQIWSEQEAKVADLGGGLRLAVSDKPISQNTIARRE